MVSGVAGTFRLIFRRLPTHPSTERCPIGGTFHAGQGVTSESRPGGFVKSDGR